MVRKVVNFRCQGYVRCSVLCPSFLIVALVYAHWRAWAGRWQRNAALTTAKIETGTCHCAVHRPKPTLGLASIEVEGLLVKQGNQWTGGIKVKTLALVMFDDCRRRKELSRTDEPLTGVCEMILRHIGELVFPLMPSWVAMCIYTTTVMPGNMVYQDGVGVQRSRWRAVKDLA